MSRTKAPLIPEKLTLTFIDGKKFIELRHAARLTGIHPVILEMAQRLLKQPDTEAGTFLLATQELKDKADQIETAFVAGLRRVAKHFGTAKMRPKCYREENRLSFWYEFAAGIGRKPNRGAQ